METRAAAVAAVIEDRMTAAGLTQTSMSALTGIPPATLNRTLRGHRAVDVDELWRIADALGVKVSTITRDAEARLMAEVVGR